MEHREPEVKFVFDSEETAKKWLALQKKMSEDKAFQNELDNAEEKDYYEIYKKYGYTDLSAEEFSKFLEQFSNDKNQQLTMEEMESVVGGGAWWRHLAKAVGYVPAIGGLLSIVTESAGCLATGEQPSYKSFGEGMAKIGISTVLGLVDVAALAIPGAGFGIHAGAYAATQVAERAIDTAMD